MRKYGSRQEVWDGLCTMTRGGLSKDDLIMSKTNKIVSKKKSEAAKISYDKFGFAKRKESSPPAAPKKKRRRRKVNVEAE